MFCKPACDTYLAAGAASDLLAMAGSLHLAMALHVQQRFYVFTDGAQPHLCQTPSAREHGK